MDSKDLLLKTPIDQYGRYSIVSSIIKQLATRKRQKTYKILDIGGYKGLTQDFFDPSVASVTIVDLYDSDDENYVKGSALELPFNDSSFDYVVSNEVLEHIPRAFREAFIEEAVRVSKGPILVTAPFEIDGNMVCRSEERLNNLWKSLHRVDHRWLMEHIENKIPTCKEFEMLLRKHHLTYKKFGNNDLLLWNLMLSVNFISTLFRSAGDNPSVQEYFNENYIALDDSSDAYYRYIYLISKDSYNTKDIFLPHNKSESKLDIEAELINKIFVSLGKDIKQKINEKNKVINKLGEQLEQRIKMYDELVRVHDLQNSELQRLNAKLHHKIYHKLKLNS